MSLYDKRNVCSIAKSFDEIELGFNLILSPKRLYSPFVWTCVKVVTSIISKDILFLYRVLIIVRDTLYASKLMTFLGDAKTEHN